MKLCQSLLITLLFSYSVIAGNEEQTRSPLCQFRGYYSYTLNGTFGPPVGTVPYTGTYNEAGILYSDGKGSVKLKGTGVINGTTLSHPDYRCTYDFPPGLFRIATMSCVVTAADPTGPSPLFFSITV